jgi:hypothetical protein
LDKSEIAKIKTLVYRADLEKLKESYTVDRTDQPTSTITFYMNGKTLVVKDYGLQGDAPLKELYQIVYKY